MTPGQRASGNGGVGWVDPARGGGDVKATPGQVSSPVARTAPPIERDTTMSERMTWGVCGVCGAKHGEFCRADVGVQLGVKLDGSRMKDGEGTHLSRLKTAPLRVRLVPA